MIKKFFLTTWLAFFAFTLLVDPTGASFKDKEQSKFSVSAGEWTRPESRITSVATLFNSREFRIDYEAEDNNLDYVELWYSLNGGEWKLFGTDTPSSPGHFDFVAREGDGLYRFLTVAVDGANPPNVEDKNNDGGDDNASQDALDNAYNASEQYQAQVDTEPPYTVLSLGEFGDDEDGENRFAVNELMGNGNFEDSSEPLRGWEVGGDGEHRVVDNDYLEEETEVRGSHSLLLGWFDSPTGEGTDYAYHEVSVSSSSAALSFWYQVISDDSVDFDWFEAKVIDSANPSIEEIILRTGSGENGGWVGDSGWREITHSLANWLGKNIKIWFAVTNHDPEGIPARTYALIDDVRVTQSDNNVTPDKEIGIGGSDPGSGVDTTYYRINGGEWQEISGGGEKSFALSDHGVGDDQEVKVDYYSVDIAGNREATKSLSLKTDKDKEYFAIVLNKISPNPSGGNKGSSDLPLDGEWVEVWNNSESDLDISGWYLKDYNGDVLPVVNHADNDDDLTTVETVVPAGGWLRIYRNGSSLFNLPEEGGEVLLFDDSDSLIDSFSYGEVDQTDKVWQRIPEGTGIWTDPEDTEFSLSLDYKEGKVNLVITGLKETTKGEYELLYKSKGIEKGVLGEVTGKEIKEGTYKEEVLLGSCSGKVCVFDKVDENKITLHLTLINPQVEMTKEFSW